MPSSDLERPLIDPEAFERAQRDFGALGPQLPGDALEGLAREVVSRLADRSRADGAALRRPPDEETERLAGLLVSDAPEAGADYVNRLLQRGADVQEIYLTHLSGAARWLGEMWEADKLSFAEVTVGVSRIYAILRALRPGFRGSGSVPRPYAVFAAVPGETHTLGVSMAADIFRRDGWEIDLKLGRQHEQLMDEIEHSDAQLIGLSASGAHALADLARLVMALRVSRPDAFIMIAGPVVSQAAEAVERIAADAVAADMDTAQRKMRLLADIAGLPAE